MGFIIDLWQEIYSTIKRNKLRTFLTGFAVSWGIFMLIVLLGSGNGIINAFQASSGDMAMNSMHVWGGRTNEAFDGLKAGRRIQLDNRDVEITRTMFEDHIIDVAASIWQGNMTVTYGQEYVVLSFSGVYPENIEMEDVTIVENGGRFINDMDIRQKRKVAVIHSRTAEVLFRDEDPIGKYVTVGKVAYQVVGIYKDWGNEENRPVYIPFSTLQLLYNRGDKLNNITFTIKNLNTIEENEAFEKLYKATLSVNHRYSPTDRGAIGIWNRFSNYMRMNQGMNILTMAIWVIGVFTLLSGIVGVSNIMLITVKERTREFGIRKALGAKPASILLLIIVESIIITTIFGYIGMVAGIGVTEYMNVVAGRSAIDFGGWEETVFLNPTVDIKVAIQATFTLVVAGTLAGFFPARKAVSIRPIEALRAD